jgi:hypothetical protein
LNHVPVLQHSVSAFWHAQLEKGSSSHETHGVLTIVDVSLMVASNRSHTSSTAASSSSSSKFHTQQSS